MAVLRNVPKTFSFEEQRIEINEIAQDLYDHQVNHPYANFTIQNAAVQAGTLGSISYDVGTGILTYRPTDISAFETDPIFNASPASGITAQDIADWDEAHSWGDHSTENYLKNINSLSINELSDVSTTGADAPVQYETIIWDGSKWKPGLVGNVPLTNFSVGPDGTPNGNGGLDYDAITGVFTYTPPDLSGYLTGLPSHTHTLIGLTDTDLLAPNAPNDGEVLTYDANDLKWKASTIASGQLNSDWNATSGVEQILNKPTLFDGDYNNLTNKPTIPTNNNQLTNGAGYITGIGTFGIGALNDVDTTTNPPANDKVLKFNGTNWVPGDASVVANLNDLGDVDTTGAAQGKILKHDGTSWIIGDDSAGTTISTLNDIGDVNVGTSITNGHILKWDNSNSEWVAGPDAQGSSGNGIEVPVIDQSESTTGSTFTGTTRIDWANDGTNRHVDGKFGKLDNDKIYEFKLSFGSSGGGAYWGWYFSDRQNTRCDVDPTASGLGRISDNLNASHYWKCYNEESVNNNKTIIADNNAQGWNWPSNGFEWDPGSDTAGGVGHWHFVIDMPRHKVWIREYSENWQNGLDASKFWRYGNGGSATASWKVDPMDPMSQPTVFLRDTGTGDYYFSLGMYIPSDGAGSVLIEPIDEQFSAFRNLSGGGGSGGGVNLSAFSVVKPNPAPSGNGDLTYSSVNGAFTYTPPDIPAAQIQADWNQSDSNHTAYINNKPTIPAAQIRSDWDSTTGLSEILNKPTIPSNLHDLSDVSSANPIAGMVFTWDGSYWAPDTTNYIQSDWNQSNINSADYIKNKPAIPSAQVQSDWNATTGMGEILNKPTLFSGSYTDLTNKPTLFDGDYNSLSNLPTLFSGSYNDLTNKPTIPADLDDLNNVNVPTPGDGEILVYNGSTSKWEPGSASGTTSTDPIGTIVIWSGAANDVPEGFQLCDGAASATSALQAIRTNVPDLRDKFVLGASGTSPTPNTTGGSKDAIVVSHSHGSGNIGTNNTGGHSHNVNASGSAATSSQNVYTTFLGVLNGGGTKYFGDSGGNTASDGDDGDHAHNFSVSVSGNSNNTGDHSHNISGNTSSEGSSGTNANLPPYYALCYIIKNSAAAGGDSNVQSNWTETDTASDAYIQNKPSIPSATSHLTNDSGYITSVGDAIQDADFSSNGLMKRTAAGTYTTVTDNSSDWDEAHGWGDHSTAGYLTSVPSGFVTGMIMMYSGTSAPSGWVICDGQNNTPDLRDKFVVGSGNTYDVDDTGGSADAVVVSHDHNASSGNTGSHTHNVGASGNTNNTGSHTHGLSAGTNNTGNHSHSQSGSGSGNTGVQSANHYHTTSTSVNTGSDGAHQHRWGTDDLIGAQGGNNNPDASGGTDWRAWTDSQGNHSHTFNFTHDTLGVSQDHTHSFNFNIGGNTGNDGGHSHNVTGNATSGGSHSHTLSISVTEDDAGSHSHNVTVDSEGVSGTGKNLPPYYALMFIMKT